MPRQLLIFTGTFPRGKAQIFTNVVQEGSSTYFILFALPKITMHTDVIECTKNTVQVNTQDPENIKQ